MLKQGSKSIGRRHKFNYMPSSKENANMLLENVQRMNISHLEPFGMDILIISTSNPELQIFWESRFSTTREFLIKPSALIIVVCEDWQGGAGNGFGSLYALQKAMVVCEEKHGVDLFKKLQEGASLAIYHTAGLGQRAAPLSSSELNNKPALKLPGFLGKPEDGYFITVLEAVIKQTSIFAPSRKGRISVFWGDQIFIPSRSTIYRSESHVDILARFQEISDETNWEKQGWQSYGLCTRDYHGNINLIDKINYPTFQRLVSSQKIHIEGGIGLSLGCFSISAAFGSALLKEFDTELREKKLKVDSDPHLWMPMSLDVKTYVELMEKKETSAEESEKWHARMQGFLKNFLSRHSEIPFLRAIDIGAQSFWWDYGTIASYYLNNLKLTQSTDEAKCMREFFKTKSDNVSDGVEVDENSCLIHCQIKNGIVKNSVLIGVVANSLHLNDCVIIHSAIANLNAQKALLYQITDETSLELKEDSVRADVFLGESKQNTPFYSYLNRDGKSDWDVKLFQNKFSYEEIYLHNAKVNYQNWEILRKREFDLVAKKILSLKY